ncbi:MAG: hypothetical protein ACKVYV_17990, partial [Limisphaerales bacterium]
MKRAFAICPPASGHGTVAARRRRPGRRARPCGDAPSRGCADDFAQNLSRRTSNGAGSTVSATVNALNQLTSGLGFSGSLAYDRRGNMLTLGSAGSGKAFAYDHENQCTTAGYYNGYNKSDFVYDGRRWLRRRLDYQWNGSSFAWSSTGERATSTTGCCWCSSAPARAIPR